MNLTKLFLGIILFASAHSMAGVIYVHTTKIKPESNCHYVATVTSKADFGLIPNAVCARLETNTYFTGGDVCSFGIGEEEAQFTSAPYVPGTHSQLLSARGEHTINIGSEHHSSNDWRQASCDGC